MGRFTDEKDGKWITVKGRHIFIENGESVNSAFQKMREGMKTESNPKELTKRDKSDIIKNPPKDSEKEELERYNRAYHSRPKQKVVRNPEDAVKWKRYDDDYEKYKSSEPKITADMQEVSTLSKMPLKGLEHRFKEKESYDRKVRDKRIGADREDSIGDAVRYTFEHPMENAAGAIKNNLKMLSDKGYKIKKIDNKWKDGGAYNGINVDIVSPDGVPMEVQYITEFNSRIKDKMHAYYDLARDETVPENIQKLAKQKMGEIAKQWNRPANIEEV